MGSEQDPLVSRLLGEVSKGDRVAGERLMPLVYAELREIAQRLFRRERADHTLEPTALVHEAWMKLVDQDRVDWQGRSHFFAVGAQAMRRILVDHARARGRDKRGGNRRAVAFPEGLEAAAQGAPDLLDLEGALARLEKLDPRQGRVVELRFFAGLSVREVAEVIGVSVRTVEAEWTAAKAWLRRELGRGAPE
ncbi:MAG: RNA polymerase subunit sigma-70 [Planctomycetes bacterium]|nr:RNA polymerase subunit sigma-70 [Planctomycetota bacterium]MDP6409445.1 sigma-70 family RNA polymerase sigma factor [Planctomycetota bacterium]